MAQSKIVGYKNIFGFVLPDWVDESLIKTIISFLLSMVAMLFVLLLVIWPKFADIDSLKASLKDGQQNLASLKNSQNGFNKLNDQISSATQDVILSAIPQSYSPESAVFLLRKLADQTGVSIDSYKLPSGVVFSADSSQQSAGGDKMANFLSFPIKISVSAPVSSLLSFIDRIETSLPYGIVSDLNMQEVTKLSKSTSSMIHMDLGVTYFQAILKKVDISKVEGISPTDFELAKRMSSFSQFDMTTQVGNTTTVPSGTNNLFGF